jgi:hypothetical protein
MGEKQRKGGKKKKIEKERERERHFLVEGICHYLEPTISGALRLKFYTTCRLRTNMRSFS